MANSLSISAELTYIRVRGIMNHFVSASKRYGLSLSLLLAIASRESRMGLAITEMGTGDNGNGYGVMQIDRRYHPQFVNAHSPFDFEANINYGAQYLASLKQDFGGNTRKAVASYNAGPSRVKNAVQAGRSPDYPTTGGDYSADVMARKALIEDTLGISKTLGLVTYAVPIGLIFLGTYNYITTPYK